MSTETSELTISGQHVEVVRKRIKNLHLAVYPPGGRVRVAAPFRVDDETIRLAVVTRLPWIRRQQRGFREQERQSVREYVNGESHFVSGLRYRLRVVEGVRGRVQLRPGRILEMTVRPGANTPARERLMHNWYRRQLVEMLPPLLTRWEPVVGVTARQVHMRRMRTRWGTYNEPSGFVYLNPELAKKPPQCVEYVLVHELVHLLERRHNERFKDLMTAFMPNWQSLREELNRAPLAHEDWSY